MADDVNWPEHTTGSISLLRISEDSPLGPNRIYRAGAFAQSDSRFLEQLIRASRHRVVEAKEVLVTEGDIDDTLFVLSLGEVEVTSHMASTQMPYHTVLRGPQFFGEDCALGLRISRSVTVWARTLCDVRTIAGSDFRLLIQSFPEDEARFHSVAQSRLDVLAGHVREGIGHGFGADPLSPLNRNVTSPLGQGAGQRRGSGSSAQALSGPATSSSASRRPSDVEYQSLGKATADSCYTTAGSSAEGGPRSRALAPSLAAVRYALEQRSAEASHGSSSSRAHSGGEIGQSCAQGSEFTPTDEASALSFGPAIGVAEGSVYSRSGLATPVANARSASRESSGASTALATQGLQLLGLVRSSGGGTASGCGGPSGTSYFPYLEASSSSSGPSPAGRGRGLTAEPPGVGRGRSCPCPAVSQRSSMSSVPPTCVEDSSSSSVLGGTWIAGPPLEGKGCPCPCPAVSPASTIGVLPWDDLGSDNQSPAVPVARSRASSRITDTSEEDRSHFSASPVKEGPGWATGGVYPQARTLRQAWALSADPSRQMTPHGSGAGTPRAGPTVPRGGTPALASGGTPRSSSGASLDARDGLLTQRRKPGGLHMSLCNDVLFSCPTKLPTKDVLVQRKVPRPVSREGSAKAASVAGSELSELLVASPTEPASPTSPMVPTSPGAWSNGEASPSRAGGRGERRRRNSSPPQMQQDQIQQDHQNPDESAELLRVRAPDAHELPELPAFFSQRATIGAAATTAAVGDRDSVAREEVGLRMAHQRTLQATDLEAREAHAMGAERMNEHDYDGLLAVRLALMQHGTRCGAADVEATPNLPGLATASTWQPADAQAPEADRDLQSPHARAQLLRSVRLELQRGLAAAKRSGGDVQLIPLSGGGREAWRAKSSHSGTGKKQ